MSSSDDSNNTNGGSAKGLFQRVLQMVSPHKNADKSHTSEFGPEEKAQLMLRKQRHDLARRSEFSKLRGLLREQEAAEKSHNSSTGQHLDKPNSRQLETIKKINALENEMVHRFSQQLSDIPSKHSTRGPSTRSSTSIQVDSSNSEFSSSFYASDLSFKTSSQPDSSMPGEAIKPVDLPVEYEVRRGATEDVLDSLDSVSDLQDAVNDEELNLLSDPMLEENAVLFASNEDEQVERNLRAMLAKDSAYRNNRVAWLVLMDFYRAVGNQPAFEKLAMNYTTIFSESAPQWVIFDPVVVKRMQAKNASSGMIYWQSPAIFDEAAALDMEEKFSSEDQKVPRLMDWNLVKEVNGKSAKTAVKLLLSLDKPGIALQVTGLRIILALLEQLIRHHNENSDLRSLWQLKLELLRLFDSQEEFDMQAMEYCLEFEVSPPDWVKPQCKCEDLDKEASADDGSLGSSQGRDDSSRLSAHNNTTMLTHLATGFYSHSVATPLRLYGDLKGSIVEELERFDDKVPKGGGFLRINCESLVRIDFVAAGDLLNWVSEKSAKGYSVQLLRVNRLVALFFIVMGISVPAHIALRKD